MSINRRNFFTTLLAPVVARFFPKPITRDLFPETDSYVRLPIQFRGRVTDANDHYDYIAQRLPKLTFDRIGPSIEQAMREPDAKEMLRLRKHLQERLRRANSEGQ